jgi:hypothetical protein
MILFKVCQKKKEEEQLVNIISVCLFYPGTNSVCADVCTSPEAHVELDLSEPRINRESKYVQIHLHHTGSGRCREPGRIKQKPLMSSTNKKKCSFISFYLRDILSTF